MVDKWALINSLIHSKGTFKLRNWFACNKGSVTLEAALSLTTLLLVGFTLVLMAHFLYAGEVLDQALFETADTAAFSINPNVEVLGDAVFQIRLENTLKSNLADKEIGMSNIKLGLKPLNAGAYLLTAVCKQPTPLLGTLIIQKNYHLLNAGFSFSHKDELFWVTDQGGRYHVAGCHTLRDSKTAHTLLLSEAIEKGYTPCKICIGKTLFGKPHE